MNVLASELLKLRRSAVWIVVLVLPLLAVITGTVNYVLNLGAFRGEWDSFWSQVTLFYGLLFCSVGIATLASAVWRMEHRGNWPRLMAGPTSSWGIVTAKLGALWVLVAAMQSALLVLTWASGVLVAGLSPALPARFVLSALVACLGGLAVAAVQSLLSMVIRSFAAPIAVAILGCVVAIGLLMSGRLALGMLVPYALLTQSLSLGSSAITDAAALNWVAVAQVAGPALVVTVVLTALAGLILDRRDVRA
ncbi:MAG: ABC transporter permease [Propionibacteriaceae bacterium]|nr:ABC transporter permease [Propionibacteriaceae bacterium]